MQLNSVIADLVLVLTHLKYIHDDQERVWYLLLDFDCLFTDLTGNTRPLPRVEPTKEACLRTLEIAAQNGSSGLVYYGGHGERCLPGFSELVRSGPNFLYKEVIEDTSGPVETYLLCKDAQRISSEEFFSRLKDISPPECVLTIVLDACHAEGFLAAAGKLPYVYDGSTEEEANRVVDQGRGSSSQRVVVTAARVGELAGCVRPSKGEPEHGALTWFMISWVSKHPEGTAVDVAQRLESICRTRPDQTQRPRISARHPLTGSFRLLLQAGTPFGQPLDNQK